MEKIIESKERNHKGYWVMHSKDLNKDCTPEFFKLEDETLPNPWSCTSQQDIIHPEFKSVFYCGIGNTFAEAYYDWLEVRNSFEETP